MLRTKAQTTIGIEVTQLCREEPRAQAGRLKKIPDTAKREYSQLAHAEPVDVTVAFWGEDKLGVNNLKSSLVNFVQAHLSDKGKNFREGLPDGYCSIGIFEPHGTTEGRWRSVRAFDVTATPKELLDDCIAEKNERVANYKLAAPIAWLLIINDHFLGPGEVRTDPDHLAKWSFKSDFDKVLLFLREAGGGGKVIELQQT